MVWSWRIGGREQSAFDAGVVQFLTHVEDPFLIEIRVKEFVYGFCGALVTNFL